MKVLHRFKQYYEQHGLPIVGWLFIAIGVIGLVGWIGLMNAESSRWLIVWPFVFTLRLVSGLLDFLTEGLYIQYLGTVFTALVFVVTGWGLIKRKKWALVLALILIMASFYTVGALFLYD